MKMYASLSYHLGEIDEFTYAHLFLYSKVRITTSAEFSVS